MAVMDILFAESHCKKYRETGSTGSYLTTPEPLSWL